MMGCCFFYYLSGDLLCVFVDGRGKSPVTMTHVQMCDKEIIRGSNHLLNAVLISIIDSYIYHLLLTFQLRPTRQLFSI